MPKIKFVDCEGERRTVDAPLGISVMEAAVHNDIPGIDAECGGNRACGTCHVFVREDWLDRLLPIEPGEEDLLQTMALRRPNSRLSCQIKIRDDLSGLTVTTPPTQRT